MIFILCEKPSVAADFNKVLRAKNFKGYYENSDYVLTYCIGHLLELYKPEDYDPQYKKWTIEDLPIIPKRFLYKPIGTSEEQLLLISKLIKKYDYNKIIVATDAGREGELIARLVLQFCKITDKSKIYRFWSSEALTESVIEKNLQQVKPIAAYDNLFAEGTGRSYADWVTGMNFSRFFSVQTNAKISIGRVQTAVLNAIYERDKLIENFVPKPYQQLQAIFEKSSSKFKGLYYENGQNKFQSIDYLKKIAEENKTENATVSDIIVSEVSKTPPKLLSLSKLQIEANKRYGFSADDTLAIAQKLYEDYKCLSYPRTPSEVLAASNVDLARAKMNLLKSIYPSFCKNVVMDSIMESNKRIFNDAKLEDHHALIPLSFLPEKANENEKKIYNIVVSFFIAAFSKNYVYDSTTLDIVVNMLHFKTKGNFVKQKGFTAAFELMQAQEKDSTADDEAEDLPDLIVGEKIKLSDFNILEKKTLPPAHFTDATILELMLNPKQEDTDKKLVGIGTEATRAVILKLLQTRNYLVHNKKNLLITELGGAVIEAICSHEELQSFVSLKQTTDWEELIQQNPFDFLNNTIINFVQDTINHLKNSKVKYPEYFAVHSEQPQSLGACPVCGKPIYENSKSYYCSDYLAGCKFSIWKTISNGKINFDNAKLLLSGQPTRTLQFINKTGRKYSAKLQLNNEKKLEFIFDKKGVQK